jgi:hypothetical protein
VPVNEIAKRFWAQQPAAAGHLGAQAVQSCLATPGSLMFASEMAQQVAIGFKVRPSAPSSASGKVGICHQSRV